MREIKFRVFDKEEGYMIQDAHTRCMWFLNDDGSKLQLDWDDDLVDMLSNPERYEPLEYTGLKDKNGVEIYEGDIVNIGRERYVIRHGEFMDKAEGGCVGIDSYGWHYAGESTFNLLNSEVCEPKLVEVIGNIYENEELLHGK